jgi:hypothetical protein
MHVHGDIFAANNRVFLSGEVQPNTQNLLQKKRGAFYIASEKPDIKYPATFASDSTCTSAALIEH